MESIALNNDTQSVECVIVSRLNILKPSSAWSLEIRRIVFGMNRGEGGLSLLLAVIKDGLVAGW